MTTTTPEAAVRDRYSQGAGSCEQELCCPVSYDPRYLRVLPDEIIERDYGCGDPTPYVRTGDVVLDLGSGAGKACWIAAQIAGPTGRVIGVDMNREMLALAAKHHAEIAERVGHDTVEFRRGIIQDLALDLDRLDREIAARPIDGADRWLELRDLEERLRAEQPLVADDSIDVILSNCVLNLVRPRDKQKMFDEMYRVLRTGGRVAVADIVCDEDVPEHLQRDPKLWSGCISGAFREDAFLAAFARAGFHGMEIVDRGAEPWHTVEGIEFRTVTVQAFKGKAGPCLERNQALIYRGPFSRVFDDDGHVFHRGERMAVCDKTFHLLQRAPYEGMFAPVSPHTPIPLDEAQPFACDSGQRRHPRASKGADYDRTADQASACAPDGCC